MPKDLPGVRVDALQMLITMAYVIVGIGTLKIVAYRYHGNPFSQALLLIV